MGGDKARTQAKVEEPKIESPEKRKRNRGGFFGEAQTATQQLNETGARNTFLSR